MSWRHGCKSFTYEELIKRDKVNLDIFWLKDESLEDSANLPDPGVLALEITEDLEAALAQFAEIAASLKRSKVIRKRETSATRKSWSQGESLRLADLHGNYIVKRLKR